MQTQRGAACSLSFNPLRERVADPFFPSTRLPLFFQRNQAASGRASAGMSGISAGHRSPRRNSCPIAGWFYRVHHRRTSLFPRCPSGNCFIKRRNVSTEEFPIRENTESMNPWRRRSDGRWLDDTLPVRYTRPWRFLSGLDKLLSLHGPPVLPPRLVVLLIRRVPLLSRPAPSSTRFHLNINLPLHCPLLLLTYLTGFLRFVPFVLPASRSLPFLRSCSLVSNSSSPTFCRASPSLFGTTQVYRRNFLRMLFLFLSNSVREV